MTPDLGTLALVSDSFVGPNGLAFSPDERVLYINDIRRGHIRAFDMLPNGLLAKQTDRVFADLHSRSERQETRAHRAWATRDHQYSFRRRRLEDALLHDPLAPVRGQTERRRTAGAHAKTRMITPAPALTGRNRWSLWSR
ncbi:MAG TPA: SMP-30/gluconolactonase/LRE family protein [Burkholderiales bacterium]|nr:SMP-30/gluconolactonase/LRE family protein [Burkholderiales bacterium]